MRVWIDADEFYPVYTVDRELPFPGAKNYRGSAEVDEETLARWEKVWADWNAVQAEIAGKVDFRGTRLSFLQREQGL